MKINNNRLNKIISKLTIKYGGCHAPHNETPLYGRHAYWRLYIGDRFIAKITAPVKSLNPRKTTLDKLLRAELKTRLLSIKHVFRYDSYGDKYKVVSNPSGLRPIIALGV